MSFLTQSKINQREDWFASIRLDTEMLSRYPSGICAYCGGDDGLNEDGVPCGYCRKGRELDESNKS